MEAIYIKDETSNWVNYESQLLVKDVMTQEPFSLFEEDSLLTLKEIMKWQSIRHIPIVDQENRIVGLLTHRDLLKLAISKLAEATEAEENQIYREIKIGKVMGRKVKIIHQNTNLKEAAKIMHEHKYGCLPVIDDDKELVGIITEADFVKLLAKY